MTKSKLIKKLYTKYGKLSVEKMSVVVNTIVHSLFEAVANQNRVEIRGFGSFCVRKRASRDVHDPIRGGVRPIGERLVPYFRMGKELRNCLNSD